MRLFPSGRTKSSETSLNPSGPEPNYVVLVSKHNTESTSVSGRSSPFEPLSVDFLPFKVFRYICH